MSYFLTILATYAAVRFVLPPLVEKLPAGKIKDGAQALLAGGPRPTR